MKTIIDHLPASSHASITDTLKTGCYRVYDAMARNEGVDVRTLDLKSTAHMDGALLQACVGFLTYDKVDFKALVAKRKSEARLRNVISTRLHHILALMDLRRIIAEPDSLPWREDHLHFWQDMQVLYESLDRHDQAEINGFFKLLCNTDFTSLTKDHLIKVQAAEVDTRLFGDQAPYVSSKYLDALFRVDAAEGLFSMEAGDLCNVENPSIYFDHGTYEFWDESSSHSVKLNQFEDLNKFKTKNPGLRFSTFEAALNCAMTRKVGAGQQRDIKIHFMGEMIVSALLKHKSIHLISVYVPPTKGLNLTKDMLLETVQEAEKALGFNGAMDELLMSELGL